MKEQIKKLIILTIVNLFPIVLWGQTDSIKIDSVYYSLPDIEKSMSCESYFKNTNKTINYSNNFSTQTHNYSGNWDFDGDFKTDSLFFIGTGGAHLYFYLRIILSSDKKVIDFPFLEIDMPCLGSINELKSSHFYPPPLFPLFVVDNFNLGILGENQNDKIYLRIDHYSEIPEVWKKRGVTSGYLLLEYQDGEMIIKDFMDNK